MTGRERLRAAARALEAAGVPDPDYDAGLLMERITGEPALKIRSGIGGGMTEPQERAFQEMIRRRMNREPLQYLLGDAVFLGALFRGGPGVLIPRPETEMIAGEGIRLLRERSGAHNVPTVLDLCCGSGCLGISVRRAVPEARVTLTDLSPEALKAAEENAAALEAECEILQGDLFAPVAGRRFDLILSNPPYIPSEACDSLQPEVMREPRSALDGGADGLDFYRRIAAEAPLHLFRPGYLVLEIGYGEAEAVADLLLAGGAETIYTEKDFSGITRMIRAAYGKEKR